MSHKLFKSPLLEKGPKAYRDAQNGKDSQRPIEYISVVKYTRHTNPNASRAVTTTIL